jgi:hypothetical protein
MRLAPRRRPRSPFGPLRACVHHHDQTDSHRAARSASVRRLEAEDEVADGAMLSTVNDRLASANDAADAALALLRRWLKEPTTRARRASEAPSGGAFWLARRPVAGLQAPPGGQGAGKARKPLADSLGLGAQNDDIEAGNRRALGLARSLWSASRRDAS